MQNTHTILDKISVWQHHTNLEFEAFSQPDSSAGVYQDLRLTACPYHNWSFLIMESLFSSSVICPYLNRLPFYITVEPTVFVQNFMSTKLFWNRCTEKDFPTNPPVIPYFHEQHTGLLIGHSFIHMSTGPPHPQKTATSSVLFFLNYL